jgi:hypothetical protein
VFFLPSPGLEEEGTGLLLSQENMVGRRNLRELK